jgi:hypothetical protein
MDPGSMKLIGSKEDEEGGIAGSFRLRHFLAFLLWLVVCISLQIPGGSPAWAQQQEEPHGRA